MRSPPPDSGAPTANMYQRKHVFVCLILSCGHFVEEGEARQQAGGGGHGYRCRHAETWGGGRGRGVRIGLLRDYVRAQGIARSCAFVAFSFSSRGICVCCSDTPPALSPRISPITRYACWNPVSAWLTCPWNSWYALLQTVFARFASQCPRELLWKRATMSEGLSTTYFRCMFSYRSASAGNQSSRVHPRSPSIFSVFLLDASCSGDT